MSPPRQADPEPEPKGTFIMTKKSTFTNFRDLGGLNCPEDRRIKSGKIYRSSRLSGLNRRDKELLDSLGLDAIVDLRCSEEVKQAPDYIPPGCKYIHAECFDGKDFKYIVVTSLAKLRISVLRGERIKKLSKNKWDSYTEMIDCDAFSEIFKLMDDGKTFLFHCTEGKDRTGIAAALIETALGRDMDEIKEEYLLSNKLRPNKDRSRLKYLGAPKRLIDEIAYCEQTHEELLEESLKTAEEKYGSLKNMMKSKYGITEERIAQWKEIYTEKF